MLALPEPGDAPRPSASGAARVRGRAHPRPPDYGAARSRERPHPAGQHRPTSGHAREASSRLPSDVEASDRRRGFRPTSRLPTDVEAPVPRRFAAALPSAPGVGQQDAGAPGAQRRAATVCMRRRGLPGPPASCGPTQTDVRIRARCRRRGARLTSLLPFSAVALVRRRFAADPLTGSFERKARLTAILRPVCTPASRTGSAACVDLCKSRMRFAICTKRSAAALAYAVAPNRPHARRRCASEGFARRYGARKTRTASGRSSGGAVSKPVPLTTTVTTSPGGARTSSGRVVGPSIG
jgi:hypothetical protein